MTLISLPNTSTEGDSISEENSASDFMSVKVTLMCPMQNDDFFLCSLCENS